MGLALRVCAQSHFETGQGDSEVMYIIIYGNINDVKFQDNRSDNFERTFGILEFSKKKNERIRVYYYDEFVLSFFGKMGEHQKVLSKLSDL